MQSTLPLHPGVLPAGPLLSAELFSIRLETPDRFLVYAPLRRSAFIANSNMVNLLADLQTGAADEETANPSANELALFRELRLIDGGPEILPITEFTGQPSPTALTLFLTTGCNLRCTYCYASAGDTPRKSMPLVVAKRGIDFICQNAVRDGASRIGLAFHGGGEPTTNWKTMTEAMAYAKAQAARFELRVEAASATNGILSDDQIDWMIANLQGVSLSFDGLPEVHDLHRPMVSGKPSSERVIHTLQRFDAAGFSYGIRVTVTADQIKHLPASVDFICRTFQAAAVQVEPAYQLGRWTAAPSAETAEFIAAYREAHERAASYGKEIHFSGARLDLLTNHFCGISQDSFALTPDGNVSACYEAFSEDNPWAKVFFYGQPQQGSDGYDFDLNALEHLRGQGVQHRKYCQGCFAKWNCGGDCYHKSLATNGALEFQGSDRCHIIRELTKDQILRKIQASANSVWCDPLDPLTLTENAPLL